MSSLVLNDGNIKTSTGVLESNLSFQEAIDFLVNTPSWWSGPNGKGPTLTLEIVKNSKNHNGKNILIVSDGDVSIEISEHGIFCYAWSGAS